MHDRARFRLPAVLVAALLLPAAVASAGVVDTSGDGFTLRTTITVSGSPADAYRIVSGSIGEWWHPDHTYSGDARNMSIDVPSGGCFCEQLANGGIVRHMTVVYANPGATLRLTGGLGPLQEMAAAGTLTWNFTAAPGGTTIEMTFSAFGYHPKGLGSMAGIFDAVLGEQMARLKSFIDTGKPAPPGTPAK